MRDVNEILGIDAAAGGFLLTRRGELVAAVEIDGIDPASLDDGARLRAARAAESVFSALPASVSVSQYQIRRDAEPLSLRAAARRIGRKAAHFPREASRRTGISFDTASAIPRHGHPGAFCNGPLSVAGLGAFPGAVFRGGAGRARRRAVSRQITRSVRAAFESARRSLGDAVDRAAARLGCHLRGAAAGRRRDA